MLFSPTRTHAHTRNKTRGHSHLAQSAMVRLSRKLLFSSQPLQGVFTRFIACKGEDVALVSGRETYTAPSGQMWPSIWNKWPGFGLNPYRFHAEPPICSHFPLPWARQGVRDLLSEDRFQGSWSGGHRRWEWKGSVSHGSTCLTLLSWIHHSAPDTCASCH